MLNLDRIMPITAPLLGRALRGIRAARLAHLDALPIVSGRVVFLGDSITEQGIWEGWFPALPTANRGVGGDAIRDVAARLDRAIAAPRAISLLIGTNDLSGLGHSRNVSDIADQMRDLIARIRFLAEGSPLLVTGVLPRSTLFKDRIQALNEHYRKIVAGAGAAYVDPWPALADRNGALRPEFTSDGLHLKAGGYRAWTDVLRPYLES